LDWIWKNSLIFSKDDFNDLKAKYAVSGIIGGIGLIIAIMFSDNFPIEGNQLQNVSSEVSEDGIMITDGLKHSVPLDKIRGGGPPRDGIPSIDDPKFVSASDEEFVSDSDIVIGLEINGDVKAYPLFIMVWHEIVNDDWF